MNPEPVLARERRERMRGGVVYEQIVASRHRDEDSVIVRAQFADTQLLKGDSECPLETAGRQGPIGEKLRVNAGTPKLQRREQRELLHPPDVKMRSENRCLHAAKYSFFATIEICDPSADACPRSRSSRLILTRSPRWSVRLKAFFPKA